MYYKDAYFKYAKELSDSRYNPLSLDEEKRLLLEYMEGSEKAYNRLVNAHLRFVIFVLKDFKIPENVDIMDLIQAGNYGLMIGIKRFDSQYSKSCRVATYCAYWIRFYIMEAIKSFSDNTSDNNVEMIFETIMKGGDRKSTEEKLRSLLGSKIQIIWKQHHKSVKVYSVRGEEEDIKQKISNSFNGNVQAFYINKVSSRFKASFEEFSDNFAYKDTQENTKEISLVATRDVLDKAFKPLLPMEKLILTLYFGLDATQKPRTLQEIGTTLNFTLERIRQLRNAAIKKIDKEKLYDLVE